MAFDQIQIFGAKVTDKGAEIKQASTGKDYAQLTVMWSSSRKDKAGQTEYGPTKFVTVRVFGFEAQDVVAAIQPGDRVNIVGTIDHFEWQSQNGPKDDWSIKGSVYPVLPRAQRQQQHYSQPTQQSAQPDVWNSAPMQPPAGDEQPPF
ncbi:single-stranded DNA-binding protein [Corynebacterium sp. ZY180755]